MSDEESNTFISAKLEDYSIYRRHKATMREHWQKRPGEAPFANQLVSLNDINERNTDYFLFDGFVCFGEHRRYLRHVPFEILSIGQYQAPETATVGTDVWIQSFQGAKRDVWYQLGNSSVEYEPYQKTFLWIADLAKHLIDFISHQNNICLEDFRERFVVWLAEAHGCDETFTKWSTNYQRRDFRHALVAHANFLYCQAALVDRTLIKQPFW